RIGSRRGGSCGRIGVIGLSIPQSSCAQYAPCHSIGRSAIGWLAACYGHMATAADVRNALRRVVDPELGVNIVDLGLVYRIEVDGARVDIAMTMTTPACPLVDYLKELVTSAIGEHVPDITDVEIAIEWEPPW